MDTRNTAVFGRRNDSDELADAAAIARLNDLLEINAEISRSQSRNLSGRQDMETAIMAHPISFERSFSYFGFMLGSLPPAAVIFALVINSGIIYGDGAWILGLMFAANLLTAVIGYISGRVVADCVRQIGEFPIWTRTKREAAREVVSTVSNWVNDFQSRKRDETKAAIEKFLTPNPSPSES